MNIRLYNARILTMEEGVDIFRGEIWVEGNKISRVIPLNEKKDDQPVNIVWDLEYDCKDNLLMPGFKNAHTHSAMTFLRSFADDVPLDVWLNEKIFPMEAKLTADDIYELNKLAVLEYLTSGVTSIFDMYLDPDAVGQSCIDTGMRCGIVGGLNDFLFSVDKIEASYEKWNGAHPLINYQLGFHAEYTCSKDLLCEIGRMAERHKAPVYTHLAETAKEVEGCISRHGVTPAVLMEDLGIFKYGGGGFHCVYMNDADMDVFKRNNIYAITNAGSNLKLASGIAPIAEFVKRGIAVAIGTDGPASNNCLDMFRELFLVSALSKVREMDAASLNATDVLRMATVNGSKAMCMPDTDVLAAGKLADIILIDLNQPNMQPIHNIAKNIVYSGSKTNVKMTMIDGRILYMDNEYHIGESPESIYRKCNTIAQRITAGI